ncbi:MAG: DEAD/DEAH box helicase, partial [Rhodospirillaceae bacterium]
MLEALASYIEATYHLSNPTVVALRRRLLEQGGIAQTPYIESTPSYSGNRKYSDLTLDKTVATFLTSLATKESGELLFDPPYDHQSQAIEFAMANDAGGKALVVTTGTGSGKTECFLLPVLARLAEEALHRPAHFNTRAVRALLLYPMNALVNDQLGRLRNIFGAPAVMDWFTKAANRPAKFGRYTGRTLYPGVRTPERDRTRLKTLEYYLQFEDKARAGDAASAKLVNTLKAKGRWPSKPDSNPLDFDGLRNWYGASGTRWSDKTGNPSRAIERPFDPELLTRHEIQDDCPDLLVTNYSMLEYMLLRPIERDIFRNTRAFYESHPDEKFFYILD